MAVTDDTEEFLNDLCSRASQTDDLRERIATLERALAVRECETCKVMPQTYRIPVDALVELTSGLDEHPESWDWPCACRSCQSYADA
jgi:hypothetical protein